jgi:hypothetical protein
MQRTLETFYEWSKWEGIMHNILLLLGIYILYLFYVNKKERTLSNILLFTIIISIDTLIHQNINIRNHKKTNYL